MLPRLPDNRVSAYDDDFEDIPSAGPLLKYLGGILLPLVLIAYGISCFLTGHGVMWGEYARLDLNGANALALGTASISLGVFLHCHYFWGNVYHLAAFAVAGKIIAAIGFIAGLGFLLIQVGVLGK